MTTTTTTTQGIGAVRNGVQGSGVFINLALTAVCTIESRHYLSVAMLAALLSAPGIA